MSLIIQTYVVDLNKLKSILGSKDQTLFKKLHNKFSDEMKELDEDLADEDEKVPPISKILEQMINGEKLNKKFSDRYGYTLEFLCQYIGKRMNSDYCSGYVSELDDVLEAKKLKPKFSIHNLVGEGRGAPEPIPHTRYSSLGIGYMTVKEVNEALKTIQSATFNDITLNDITLKDFCKESKKKREFLKDLPEVIKEIITWLKTAQKKKSGLICFFY